MLRKSFGDHFSNCRPINWDTTFPEIMKSGGFDIVIGNPPYVNEARKNKELFRELRKLPKLCDYYEKNMDLFNYFIEIGLDILKYDGFLGFIIPSYWQDRTGATLLRHKIIKETNIEYLVDLGEIKVFLDAPGQHNNIIVLRKIAPSKKNYQVMFTEVNTGNNYEKDAVPNLFHSVQTAYGIVNNKFVIGQSNLDLVEKIKRQNTFYLQKNEIMRGVDTSPSTHKGEGVFVIPERQKQIITREMDPADINQFIKPFYHANQIHRYYYEDNNLHWLIYTDAKRKKILEENEDKYKSIITHLKKFEDVITSDNKPYGLHRAKTESNFQDKNKILFVRKAPNPTFAIIPIPYFVDESVYVINWNRPPYDPRYFLAIINSALTKWWFSRQKKHGTQLQMDKEQILSFPIHSIDLKSNKEKNIYRKLVRCAQTMMDLNVKRIKLKASTDDIFGEGQRKVEGEINKTDSEIDALVFKLYGLSAEETSIIEGDRSSNQY